MINDNIQITFAHVEDAAEILDLQKRAFATEVESHHNRDIEPMTQTIGEIIADFASHTFLKAMSDEVIVGSVKYSVPGNRVWVEKLIVDIPRRGRGLGRRLLSEVEALNPDAERFQLFTAASSTHNIRLYESVGYRVVRKFRDPAQKGFQMVEMIKVVGNNKQPYQAMMPTLFIMSGLPASGKSSLARILAAEYGATWLRIDTIEQALRELCGFEPQGEGYRLAYRIAADNLSADRNVVADSCNPWDLTRQEWNAVARKNSATALNIEVLCSDIEEHRQRVETRESEVAGLKLPDWSEVCAREYHPWNGERITIDTAGKSIGESFDELRGKIEKILNVGRR